MTNDIPNEDTNNMTFSTSPMNENNSRQRPKWRSFTLSIAVVVVKLLETLLRDSKERCLKKILLTFRGLLWAYNEAAI